MGFKLIIGFIEHLQLLTTDNYNSLIDLQNLQITTASTKSALVVAW